MVVSGSRRVLNHGRSSTTPGIATAIVMKTHDVVFLTMPDGRVPMRGPHGFGLYFHDCRYMNGYEMTLAGHPAEALVASSARGFMATFELSNPDLRVDGSTIEKETVAIECQRVIDGDRRTLYDRIVFTNFGVDPLDLPVSFAFQSSFESVFAIRGVRAKRRGLLHEPRWHKRNLVFAYDGADGVRRSLSVHVSEPAEIDGTTARLRLTLEPERPTSVLVALRIGETRGKSVPSPVRRPDVRRIERALVRRADRRRRQQTSVCSNDARFDRVIERSLRDLHVLTSRLDRRDYYAAGVPWYVALFGRDSLISSLETLAYDARVAATTLRLLARRQGRHTDEWRDEEPGKILHEQRVGEMAHLDEIPQTPYYGSIDATPLFLVLLARHAAWAGGVGLLDELRPNVEAALGWIDRNAAANGGYVAYASRSKKGLANQGWKDSGDAIVNRDGSLARPPIALAEVQGYVYLAKRLLAELYERAGDRPRAGALEREANDLRTRFNRDFWLDDAGTFALALQREGRPAAVVASNAGQVLWSGIADPDKARRTADRLTASDAFSGWGVRTLGAKEARYNPIGYHLGTVWPHDNALIAAGFRLYGCDAAACRIFSGIVEAASCFPHERLPEVFAGFDREHYDIPVHYPVACHPQAWAAGAVPYLLETALGLSPDADADRLRIVRPVLPDFLTWVELRRLRVGKSAIGLRF